MMGVSSFLRKGHTYMAFRLRLDISLIGSYYLSKHPTKHKTVGYLLE